MCALLRKGSRIDDSDGSRYGLIDGQSKDSLTALYREPLAWLQGSKKSGGGYCAEYREWKRGIFTLLCCVSWPGWTEHRSAFRGSHVTSGAHAEFESSAILYGWTTQGDHRQRHFTFRDARFKRNSDGE